MAKEAKADAHNGTGPGLGLKNGIKFWKLSLILKIKDPSVRKRVPRTTKRYPMIAC